MIDDKSTIDAIANLARAASAPVLLHSTPGSSSYFVATGKGGVGEVIQIALDQGAAAPHRKRGNITVFDVASLNQILRDNKDAGDAVIYVNRDATSPSIVGVLNSNGPHGAGHQDFRVALVFRPTASWLAWRTIDGKMMAQAAFAEFIEDNLDDILTPTGAEMLEIVQYFQAKRDTDFKSALRLNSGTVQLQNIENVDAKVGAGRIDVPETFSIALAPFIGCGRYEISARFRYRIVDGKLTLGLRLQRIQDLTQKIMDDAVAKIERGTDTGVVLIEGIAPST